MVPRACVAWLLFLSSLTALAQDPSAADGPPTAAPVEVVNDRRPLDSLDGPPFVTAKAWAIADGRTGELLWGKDESVPRPMASTTKIMTALLVFELAEHDPALLDEIVHVSKRADDTGGSTAGIRAGERLPVRELLYGLLLPSGNDAAVALAEHVGGRFPSPPTEATSAEPTGSDEPADGPRPDPSAEADVPENDPLDRFVAAMNCRAAELGMQETRYLDPHGNGANRASPRDLLKLAHVALANERFHDYVTTRDHACTLDCEIEVEGDAPRESPAAASREVKWRNTNQLLGHGGYDGVKTGTTGAAGACLVSSSRRPKGDETDHLLLVVLGSTSSDSRYVDTRNLYRWAWRERGHGR